MPNTAMEDGNSIFGKRLIGEVDAMRGDAAQVSNDLEVVDPIEQLFMSLRWAEDYADDYKYRVLREAIEFVIAGKAHA